ncbi:STAS domain-containing protein [Amycolatopsis sp. NPDC051903]|uniref:STAS domain-containing protein n=1 Tax=Amycolatopsis sp. NPDC051903 TaxID=3363936 RepID=UPI0037AB8303
MGSASPVSVTTVRTPAGLVARVSGELDGGTATESVRLLFAGADVLPAPELVVLDLTALSMLSAAGLRALLRFARDFRERGVRIHLVCPDDSVTRRVLNAVSVGESIPVFATVDQALNGSPA